MGNVFYLDTLQPADRLVLPKSNASIVQHHVIYYGKDGVGNRLYLENAIGKGVQLVSETHVFRDGKAITRVERFLGNQYQRNAAIQRATQLIGKQYNLLKFNCEHYANTVQHRKNHSKQVGNGVMLAGALALLFISTRRPD